MWALSGCRLKKAVAAERKREWNARWQDRMERCKKIRAIVDADGSQTCSNTGLGVDLAKLLRRWVAAARSNELSMARALHAELLAVGINPETVWPDATSPTSTARPILKNAMVQATQEATGSDEDLATEAKVASFKAADRRDDFATEAEVASSKAAGSDEDLAMEAKVASFKAAGSSDDFATEAEVASSEDLATEAEVAKAQVLAREYYDRPAQSVTPASSVQPVSPDRAASFAPVLLEQAPCSIQSCGSLLILMQRKVGKPAPAAPIVSGPSNALEFLQDYADYAGRLSSLSCPTGWDARGLRVVDILTWLSSAVGMEILQDARRALEEEAASISQLLPKSSGHAQSIEMLTQKRQAWAFGCARWDWLVCCSQLLSARLANLQEDMSACHSGVQRGSRVTSAVDDKKEITMFDIVGTILGRPIKIRPEPAS